MYLPLRVIIYYTYMIADVTVPYISPPCKVYGIPLNFPVGSYVSGFYKIVGNYIQARSI